MFDLKTTYRESMFTTKYIAACILPDGKLKCMGYIKEEESSAPYYDILVFELEDIKEVSMATFQKSDAIRIRARTAGLDAADYTMYLPDLTSLDELKSNIQSVIESKKRIAENEKKRQLEMQDEFRIRKQQEAIRKQQEEEKQIKYEQYYMEQFLSVQEKYPLYIFEENDDLVAFMYINENKDLFIKSIDKIQMESIESVILYKDIHYYEKAGNIHYVSDIDINYSDQSFAGSFVPGKISLTPAVLGGLLLGPMGMGAGAIIGNKPAHFVDSPKNSSKMSAKSEVHKIDDRSVILNYYSEKYKQYKDIELPKDIYNYLQTHIAEKKHDIVSELERKTALHQAESQIKTGEIFNIGSKQENAKIEEKTVNPMEEFKAKVEKLKIMKEAGMLSDEEFNAKRDELLNSI